MCRVAEICMGSLTELATCDVTSSQCPMAVVPEENIIIVNNFNFSKMQYLYCSSLSQS